MEVWHGQQLTLARSLLHVLRVFWLSLTVPDRNPAGVRATDDTIAVSRNVGCRDSLFGMPIDGFAQLFSFSEIRFFIIISPNQNGDPFIRDGDQ